MIVDVWDVGGSRDFRSGCVSVGLDLSFMRIHAKFLGRGEVLTLHYYPSLRKWTRRNRGVYWVICTNVVNKDKVTKLSVELNLN